MSDRPFRFHHHAKPDCDIKVLILLLQILDTIFKQNHTDQSTLYLMQTNVSIQSCRFVSVDTAVPIMISYESSLNEITLRMADGYFSLNTSDKNIKIIHFQGKEQVSWMLWKTEFQINSYHTISSYKNFTNDTDRIVSFEPGETYHGTISETQYASGTKTSTHFKCRIFNLCATKKVSFGPINERPIFLLTPYEIIKDRYDWDIFVRKGQKIRLNNSTEE